MNDFTTLAWSNLSKQGHDQGLCHTWVKVTHIPKNRKEVQHSIYIIHNKTSLKKKSSNLAMKSIYFKEFVLSRFKWFVGQERGTKSSRKGGYITNNASQWTH